MFRTRLALAAFVTFLSWGASLGVSTGSAQPLSNRKHSDSTDRFYQIDQWLPTPGSFRTASGAPGPLYWQQRADYDIDVTLDDAEQKISGISKITYHNQSPHSLSYVWVQLDQNRFHPDSDGNHSSPAPSLAPKITFDAMTSILAQMNFDGGFKIDAVTSLDPKTGKTGDAMNHTIVKTMMRIDLDRPLAPNQKLHFAIQYHYNIVDAKVIRARGGYEHFDSDDNYIYEIAQWYPRVVAYTDYTGWQHKQFLGRGEFTLELGNYDVSITVPAEMVVAATGTLKNAKEVMKAEWSERLAEARSSAKPMFVITPEEAKANESQRTGKTKTWQFHAENVRDFAFAASRKFIWDALGVDIDGKKVMAMSYYPNEAEPLWSQYSTEAIAHTLEVYGRYSFAYPYPVAISVNGPVYGMEYPMICFNGPRPEDDKTYTKATKYGLISVIIHEVGHNFYPMIVNSDERQWTWMDEGLNTFLQYLTEQEWEEDYPSRRGIPEKIVPYMRGGNQRPIMSGSEEILQFGNNAYGKPATALNILRETILGRELFDFAFREYARRWKFKRPTPSDFFRTMEDASGTDLDWFWRGWFYSTDHVDIAIDKLELFQIDNGDPDTDAERKRKERDEQEPTVSKTRDQKLRKRIEWQAGLKDFYNSPDYDELAVDDDARKSFQKFVDGLDAKERAMLRRTTNFYVASFRNVGGLVMPIIVRLHYSDNTSELVRIPVDIWRHDGNKVRKMFVTDKEITRMELDPMRELADTETSNNFWPPRIVPSRFKLYKDDKKKNPMQKAGLAEKSEKDEPSEDDADAGSDKSKDAKAKTKADAA
ncbi:Aminopeptidase N [Rubripirellula lacrimiformis]|uniref:Aminopeptidase N n=1 Tax=Rubripirellula lacrimiformis TaxID=1930273 RepID=A0A517NFH9_9BACT|nr:M1 family metallopeptidase [Rubripirellula lacrimiformis]QDT05892.1 Aminopeptidase N [Rubripirellula lacrimiformis]